MRNKGKIFYKIFVVIFIIILVFGGGYCFSYFRYNDKDIVINGALQIQNKLLQDEIEQIDNLKKIKGEYLIGKVITRNIYDFYNEIVINLGGSDGVNSGDAVVNGEGLIGIVYKVDENKSYVKLLNSDYNISVKINETYGNLNRGKVTLLDKFSEIKKGDKVYTSEFGEMPANIYVGDISYVGMDNDGLGQEVKINMIDNNNLNYVAIFRGVS